MTIYKQILESSKPASEFGKDEQVVELNFVLGLVDSEEAKKELEDAREGERRCSDCKYENLPTNHEICVTCVFENVLWEPKEKEEK
jgi:hypothetical protein